MRLICRGHTEYTNNVKKISKNNFDVRFKRIIIVLANKFKFHQTPNTNKTRTYGYTIKQIVEYKSTDRNICNSKYEKHRRLTYERIF